MAHIGRLEGRRAPQRLEGASYPGVVQVPQKLEHDQKKGERKYISVPRLYHLDGACNTRGAPKRSQGPLVPWSLKEVG